MNLVVLDIGGTYIKYASCIDGVLGDVSETPSLAKEGGPALMERVYSVIENFPDYDAIGISTAGQVDSEKGRIIYANSNIPKYTGTEIRQLLTNRFHVPVFVENDVNSAAIGEGVYGSHEHPKEYICLTYGTGVGGALVLNSRLYHGSSNSAAEFGALVTHADVRLKGSDPFDGCYERYASTTALVQKAKLVDSSLENGRLIFQSISRPEVKAVIDDWINEVCIGLASLIHIFNPSHVFLGGGVMEQPYVIENVHLRTGKLLMDSFSHVIIRNTSLGNKAGLMGINYLTEQYVLSL